MIFAASVVLFQLANTAMLPLIGSTVTMRSAHQAPALVAACIVAPQFLVALTAPWVGRRSPTLWAGVHCCSLISLPCRSEARIVFYDC